MPSLEIQVDPGPGQDSRYAADLTWDLEEALRTTSAERVDRAAAPPAQGAKGAALEWANLAVTFSGGLPAIITLIRGWLSRNSGTKVTLELDGDRIVLEGASREHERQLVEAFLARHGSNS